MWVAPFVFWLNLCPFALRLFSPSHILFSLAQGAFTREDLQSILKKIGAAPELYLSLRSFTHPIFDLTFSFRFPLKLDRESYLLPHFVQDLHAEEERVNSSSFIAFMGLKNLVERG
jgi:hypothetical protein